MQMIILPDEAQTTSACYERNRGNPGEVLVSIKCFRNNGYFINCFLGESPAIPVCLSESCLSYDVTRELRY